MADLVTKLILENSEFIKNLKLSKQEIDQFKAVGAKVTGTIGKLAGAFGLAMGAAEFFSKTIRGSQTTSDAYDAAIRACTTSVDTFFTALSTGDFSAFDRGINGIITKAKEANAALDQLGNTVISFDYASGKNNALFGQKINVMRDKEASHYAKDRAQKEAQEILAKQKEYTQTLESTTIDAVKKVVAETSVLSADDIDIEKIEHMILLDAEAKRDEKKAELDAKYKEWQVARDIIIADNTTTVQQTDADGHFKNVDVPDEEKIKQEMEYFNEQYEDAILYNEILVENGDKWLKGVASNMSKLNSAKMAINTMERTYNRASAPLSQTTTTTTTPSAKKESTLKKEDIKLPSFDEYDDIEFLDADRNSRSIKELRDEISLLDKKINETTDDAERMNLINRKEGLEEVIDEKLGKKPNVETKVETKLVFDDGSLNYLMAQEKELIEQFNAAQSDEDRAKIYAELVLVRKKKDDMGMDDKDQKSKGQAAAESWAQGYASSMANADFSTKEGREAVAQQTIDSIKALIIARAIESTMKLPFPANIIAAPLAATAVAGLFSLIPKFESGGIVSGNHTIGDMNIARVNSGEMILNNHQQHRLFNILNNGGVAANSPNSKVEFKIRGRELVGVLNNYNNKISKVI